MRKLVHSEDVVKQIENQNKQVSTIYGVNIIGSLPNDNTDPTLEMVRIAFEHGKNEGYDEGYHDGYKEAQSDADCYDDAYDRGYEDGYDHGIDATNV